MNFNKYSVGFLEDNGYLKDGDIQDNEKAINRIQGFYRTMGEIGIMMLTFAIKEIMQSMWADDDDDSEIMHKFKNIAMYQADRTFKELILFVPLLGSDQQYQMIKSPIASSRTMGELDDVLMEKLYGEETGLLRDGSVAIPQVVVYDEATGIAGTIDLLIVKPDGTLKIVDLKTSKDGLKDYAGITGSKLKYDKDWEVKESLLIEKGFPNLRLSKRQQHNLQVNMYRRMLENMGYTMSSDDNATSTMHIKVDIKGKEQKQKFKGTFEFEEYVVHPR